MRELRNGISCSYIAILELWTVCIYNYIICRDLSNKVSKCRGAMFFRERVVRSSYPFPCFFLAFYTNQGDRVSISSYSEEGRERILLAERVGTRLLRVGIRGPRMAYARVWKGCWCQVVECELKHIVLFYLVWVREGESPGSWIENTRE